MGEGIFKIFEGLIHEELLQINEKNINNPKEKMGKRYE